MAAVFTPHNFLLAVMVTAVALAVVGVCRTEPGGLTRALGGEHTGRHVRPAETPRAPHRPPLHHHAAPRRTTVPASLSALETVPDAPVSPFAARTA